MLRMQEMAFPCFKFKFSGGVCPQTPHSCVVGRTHTLPSAIAIPFQYITSQNPPPPHGKILKNGPGGFSGWFLHGSSASHLNDFSVLLVTLLRPSSHY
jgi:hypothetical protein